MLHKRWSFVVTAAGLSGLLFAGAELPAKSRPVSSSVEQGSGSGNAVLWREPADIASRNLYYGPGGENDQPHGPYTFISEDLDGTNPKYVVLDRDNIKWTVKLGSEARPETVASRLVWAAGYFTNEDYYLADLQVGEMPSRLKRGRKLVGPGGSMHSARLKRHLEDEKTAGNWQWLGDPFIGTRELSGLKVMMALINNWDLKDANNKIYNSKGTKEQIYAVSDLGASFGTTNLAFPISHSKGDLTSYERSKFIARITPEYIDFRTPTCPSFVYAYFPWSFVRRTRLDGLLHHVPRGDARWMGHILAELSGYQIQDAFRAAGYTPEQVERFSEVVQERIAALNKL